MGFGAYLVGVAFWVFVGAVAVAQIMADYQKRRMNVDLLRTIIEKGQAIDPALVAKLMSPDVIEEERTDPQLVKLGGIVTTATGVGIAFLAYFIAQIAPIAFYPILGGGVVTICVGAGLLIGAKAMANARAGERTNKSAP
jgi:hypothetical protein